MFCRINIEIQKIVCDYDPKCPGKYFKAADVNEAAFLLFFIEQLPSNYRVLPKNRICLQFVEFCCKRNVPYCKINLVKQLLG